MLSICLVHSNKPALILTILHQHHRIIPSFSRDKYAILFFNYFTSSYLTISLRDSLIFAICEECVNTKKDPTNIHHECSWNHFLGLAIAFPVASSTSLYQNL